jgi:hypothetical protein
MSVVDPTKSRPSSWLALVLLGRADVLERWYRRRKRMEGHDDLIIVFDVVVAASGRVETISTGAVY